ncbi:MAG TPA: hypothetical protein VM925_15425 [Labilithrix sp.]|nr:hypothetical protein [Labilithrix sp.]
MPLDSTPGFAVVAEPAETTLTLRFRGNADMSSIEPLDDYLRKVHEDAGSTAATAVIVDFRELEFMNSSCFKCFVEWLGKVQDLPPESRYRVIFDSNRDVHWQRRSLNALRSFAMDVVTVESR